jgi:hypothetical protein
MFNKNHATVIHSQEMVKLALEGYHPELKDKFMEVMESVELAQSASHDINTNYIISSRRIEKMLIKRYERINRI